MMPDRRSRRLTRRVRPGSGVGPKAFSHLAPGNKFCCAVRPYDGPVPRAIDFHVHLPTPDWLDGSMAGYVQAGEAYFRSRVERQSLDQLAAKYRALDATAVLLAWDAETATGRPRVPNVTVADAVRAH